MIGIGIDAVDIDRFRTTLARRASIAERLFTPGELAYARQANDPTERLAAGMSGTVEAMVADIAERDQSGLIASCVDKYGSLDILVNNAGMNIPKRSLAELSIEDWHNVVDTNLHGTFHVIHAALPIMREQGDGLIINVTSISGKRTISDLAGAAYCASKFVSDAPPHVPSTSSCAIHTLFTRSTRRAFGWPVDK